MSGIDAELARFGTISGRVTDEEGNPLGGIFIDVLEVTDEGPPFDSPGGTTTAANGTYRFPFTPAGTYVVGFTDLDGTYVNEYYDDQLSIFDAAPVTVTAGGVTPAIDAELAVGGQLSGTVTDSEGNGLGGIEIELAREAGPDEWFGFGEEFGFQTDDDGTYQLDGLPAGAWRVGFVDQEGSYLSEYYDDVDRLRAVDRHRRRGRRRDPRHRRGAGRRRPRDGHRHRRAGPPARGHLRVAARPGGRQLVLLRRGGDRRGRHVRDGRAPTRHELPGLVRVAG